MSSRFVLKIGLTGGIGCGKSTAVGIFGEAGKLKCGLERVERVAAAYGLEVWELLGPELPLESRLADRPPASRVHNSRK